LHAVAELDVFLVEKVERPQLDVGDFLLTERDDGTRCGILGRCRLCRCGGVCAARERQRHAGRADERQGFPPTLLL
jgi:hypothetical protein